ncbi:MAG: DUF6390 family protein [Actinocatenispora sp.]
MSTSDDDGAAAGAVLFARYAYPPNALGYCGPADHHALLEYGSAGVADPGLRRLAAGFEGAWSYLELIAESAGITDPLDRRVVEAYWVGNRWLERVDRRRFGTALRERFRPLAGHNWNRLADWACTDAAPHHSFQVFAVYPWVGLLGAGAGGHALHVLDRCRIRWGRVLSVTGDDVVVRSRPLRWDGRRLTLGAAGDETATASATGLRLAPRIVPGDWVSLHWDWVCDRLDARQLAGLRRYTARQLDLTNDLLATPGVARTSG